MVSIKDLVDELGGGRSVGLGAVLVVCCYVAASRYVDTVESRLADIEARTRSLEAAKQRFDAFESANHRINGEHAAALESRLVRIERQIDGH